MRITQMDTRCYLCDKRLTNREMAQCECCNRWVCESCSQEFVSDDGGSMVLICNLCVEEEDGER